MEDALVRSNTKLSSTSKVDSLNPCFNGRCTSTIAAIIIAATYDRCLNPCFNGRCTSTTCVFSPTTEKASSLNPCFNGRCTSTRSKLF